MAESSVRGQMKRTGRRGHRLPPRSEVWKQFTRVIGDDGKEKAKCMPCGTQYAIHGTTNLLKHLKECVGQESGDVQTARPAVAQSPPWPPPPCAPSPSRPGGFSDCREPEPMGEARKHLARMIALRGYDPLVVEDDCFRSFVESLNPEFRVPSRVDIEEMSDGIFDEARTDSFSKLRRAPGRLSFAVGEAKTIEAGEVMYITCHFIDDQWNLHKVVVDAVMPVGHHGFEDGPILGVHVVDAADYFNDVISEHKDRLSMVAYETTDDDIHTGLKHYIEEIISDRILSCTATYVDNVLHSIAECCLRLDPDFIINMLKDMMDLALTRQERLELLSKLGLDYGWAYDQPWCAFYYSLEVLRRKRGFTRLAGAESFVELLCKVWGQVYCGIQRISASNFPTSNLCLAELLKLREILQPEVARFSGDDPDLQDGYDYFYDGDAVYRTASYTLDKAIQDSYLVWSVPLALDPRYKLRYIEFRFERAFGSEEAAKYVSEVTTKINKLYDDYTNVYGTATAADHSHDANEMVATTSADPLFEQDWIEQCRSQVNSSCLDRYLQDSLAPATKDFDILNWWKAHSSEYPMVARMASDALAMPTCKKLSSDQIAQVRSILRSYSRNPHNDKTFSSSLEGKRK